MQRSATFSVDVRQLEEQSLPILRRDFTDQTHCCLCKVTPHPLTSGKAKILRHPVHGEIAAGPVCADRYGIRPAGLLPDLTRAVESDYAPRARGKARIKNPGELVGESGDTRRKNVEEYLILRQEKLPRYGFLGVATPILDNADHARRHGKLTADMVGFVSEEMTACAKYQPELSLENLQCCNATAYWLGRCIKVYDNNFRRSLQRQLLEKRRLSDRQMEELNKDIHRHFGADGAVLKFFDSGLRRRGLVADALPASEPTRPVWRDITEPTHRHEPE